MKQADRAFFPAPPRRPAYVADQPVAELGFAEQFATWAMRVQWTHIGDGRQQSLVLQRAFDALDMPEGAELVAELTEALIRSTRRPLSIPCPKWRVLTGDEARLLAFVAAMQARDGTPLADCDPDWRAPKTGSSVWAPAQRLALAFAAAGLRFGMTRMGEPPFPLAMPRLH
ncbi:hypothetical protein [Parvibaculum sp.]|uniref:hypothetical protein n=1 Tax=Parvibaculum sp. TaxID=2024848 RepID=UPI002B8C2376|nr:hypothetical protein [Parvibaculum sp.]HUD50141.1 hypothetical protein [Parvibaculum sp.]